jgi:hypothetical protein
LDYAESPSKSWYTIPILGEVDLDNQGRIAEKSDRKACIVFFPSRLLNLFAPCNQLSSTDVARQRTCGNEKFESASTEVRSVGSGWLEIIVDGKLGRNYTGRLADAQQARAPPLLRVAVRTRIECAHSLELPSYRQARAKSASTS